MIITFNMIQLFSINEMIKILWLQFLQGFDASKLDQQGHNYQ